MPTPHEKVAATLAELQAELAQLDEIDPAERQKIRESLAELRAPLREKSGGDPARSQRRRIRRPNGRSRRAGRIEGLHPTFRRALSNIVGILGQMGF